MALIRPGSGPGPVPGGATPPTPPAWITGGTLPPDPGGPAWHFNGSGMPPMPGNLGAGVGHPSSFYTNPGTGGGATMNVGGTATNEFGPAVVTPHGAGWNIPNGVHPVLQLITGHGGPTNTGYVPGSSPPAWWPAGAPWPPAGWGGTPDPGFLGPPVGPPTGDPFGPPNRWPGLRHLLHLYGS